MSDPKRLLLTSPNELERALLQSALRAGPTSEQGDVLWAAIASRLPPPPPPAGHPNCARGNGLVAGGGAAKSVAFPALVKGACALTLAGALAAGMIARPRTPPLPPFATATTTAQSSHAPAAMPSVPEASTPVDRNPGRESSTRAAVRPMSKAPARPTSTDGVLRESQLGIEIRLLRQCRTALRAGRCTEALAGLDDLGARFPQGAMSEEREWLLIEALACVGRVDDASARAEAFARDHPSSPLAEAVVRFVQ